MDALSKRGLATVRHRSPEPLGWEGIGGIVILLVAAVSLRNWLPDSSVAVLLLRLVWVFLYVAAVVTLTLRFGAEWLVWTARQQPALCVLLMVASASCLWSLAPLVSLQKAASLLGTTALGVFIGFTCPPRRIMAVLLWTFTLLLVSSLVVIVVLPAPETVEIGWLGIMSHKNTFGAAAALATIFFLVVTLRGGVPSARWGAALCTLSIIALTQTRSRTSFVALAVSLVVLTYLSIAAAVERSTLMAVKRLSLGLVLCVSVLPLLVGPLAAVLSTDISVNGRTRLWSGVSTILGERPLTGYGYAVVWGKKGGTLLPHIAITSHRSAATAHNSILDIASELGIPAAILVCFYLFAAIAAAGRLFERAPSAFSLFALLFLVSITVMGFAEAHLLRIHSMFWILFVAVTVAVKRSLERPDGTTSSGDVSV